MSPPSDEGKVGYGRPPKKSRWKKGQSGNLRRRYRTRPLGALELIDSLLLQKIKITENGVARLATKLEAILLQLWRKELDGDLKALSVRLRFQDIANQYADDESMKVTFADNDYTRALAAGLKQKTTADE